MIVLNGTGPNAGQTLDAWCVDLFDHLQASTLYNIVPLTTAGVGFPNPILTQSADCRTGFADDPRHDNRRSAIRSGLMARRRFSWQFGPWNIRAI